MRIWQQTALSVYLVLAGAGAQAQTVPPFIMVVNSDTGPDNQYFDVLNAYATPEDYFGAKLVSYDSALGGIVGAGHFFAVPPKLANVAGHAANGCLPNSASLVVYDAADADTPAEELESLAASVKTASGYIANSPGGCESLATSFGPDYIGINVARCSYSSTFISNNQYNNYAGSNIFQSDFDWTGVSLIVLQAQQLLNDGSASPSHAVKCASPNQIAYVDNYVFAIQDMVSRLRVAAPNAALVAQFSFRYTNPQSMIDAMSALTGAGGVDGFYLAYPIASSYPCTYCTANDLQTVLTALRP